MAQKAGGADSDRGQAVAVDASGHVYVTGYFSETSSFGPTNLVSSGTEDIFLAKYEPEGALLWARKAGGPDYDEGRGVAVDAAGNVYVGGLFQGTAAFGSTNLNSAGQSDVFLAKYTPAGNLLWARAAGGKDYDEAHGLALDGAGNVYVAGAFDANANFGAFTLVNGSGSSDIFLAKYDAAGNVLWARQAGGNGDDQASALAVDAATNLYVSGFFSGTATFGSTNLTSRGANTTHDLFVAKYNAAGTLLWVIQAGGNDEDAAQGIATDGSGNIFVTGNFTTTALFGSTNVTGNGTDIFVAKYDPAGHLVWVRKAGGNNVIYGDTGFGIAVDAAGAPWVTGYFSGTASFGSTNLASSAFDDIFVAKYDPAGNLLWVRKAGGLNIDLGYALALDGSTKAFVTGLFFGTAGFGTTNLVSSGLEDCFLTSLGWPAPPVLSIGRAGQNVLLSWPRTSAGFVLESRPTFPSGTWGEVSGTTVVVGNSNVVTLPGSDWQSYFRLRKP